MTRLPLYPPMNTLRPVRQAGFTLIELMIAVVVVAVLAAIALPSFMDSIRKSRRSDAFTALAAVQHAQERWRGNNANYANNTQLTLPWAAAVTGDPTGLGLSASASAGYYAIAIANDSATGYTVTATAVSGKSQVADGDCARLRVRATGGNIVYGAAPASGDTFDESSGNRCWAR